MLSLISEVITHTCTTLYDVVPLSLAHAFSCQYCVMSFFPGVRVQGVCCSIMDNVSAWFASDWREVVGGLLWLGLTC